MDNNFCFGIAKELREMTHERTKESVQSKWDGIRSFANPVRAGQGIVKYLIQ